MVEECSCKIRREACNWANGRVSWRLSVSVGQLLFLDGNHVGILEWWHWREQGDGSRCIKVTFDSLGCTLIFSGWPGDVRQLHPFLYTELTNVRTPNVIFYRLPLTIPSLLYFPSLTFSFSIDISPTEPLIRTIFPLFTISTIYPHHTISATTLSFSCIHTSLSFWLLYFPFVDVVLEISNAEVVEEQSGVQALVVIFLFLFLSFFLFLFLFLFLFFFFRDSREGIGNSERGNWESGDLELFSFLTC